jgi:hypothetical protein
MLGLAGALPGLSRSWVEMAGNDARRSPATGAQRHLTPFFNHYMRTVKVVVIGDSGVGKTSLRGQVRTIQSSVPRLALRITQRSTSLATSPQLSVRPLVPILSPRHYPITPSQISRSLSRSGSVPAPTNLSFSTYPHRSHDHPRIQPGKSASRPFLLHFSVVRMLSSSSST